MKYVNLAFYAFLDLPKEGLAELRGELLEFCQGHGFKGTVLLAPEGLNVFVAGSREAVDALKSWLACHPLFAAKAADFPYKESLSEHQPFNRLLVRLKKEIITMGRPEISPARRTGKRLAPETLKTWLDEGRDLVLLDTRNDYEVRLGTFAGAVSFDLKTFRQFPAKLSAAAADLRSKTVVSFCTGGIRCEKASALLLNEGVRDAYQLDGGILGYFEKTGGAHFQGECFVFDTRVAVDTGLQETGAVLCYACQNPVTAEEQKHPHYVYEISCPHCHGRPIEHKERIAAELTAVRHAARR